VKGTVTVTWDGQSSLVRRQEMEDDPEPARRLAMENEVKAWLPQGSVLKLNSAGPFDSVAPLVATLDVEMPAAASITGARVLMPLSLFTLIPFAAEQRQNMLDFHYPRTISDEVTRHGSNTHPANVEVAGCRFPVAARVTGNRQPTE